MDTRRFRLVLVGLALALLAVAVLALGFAPEGSSPDLPDAVERVEPTPNSAFAAQVGVEVDMQVGYGIELFVDGQRVFDGEIDRIEATGQFFWRPAPGQVIEEWTPGTHRVRIVWDRIVGLPDPGSYEWSFRIQ